MSDSRIPDKLAEPVHGPPPRSPNGEPPPVTPEDAGSRALEDALRSSFFFIKIVMVLLVVGFLASGFFTVKPNQVAVVLRFGKPLQVQPLQPGLHWSLPYPIDEIVSIPFNELHLATSSVGWYASTVSPDQETTANEPPEKPSLTPGVDGYTLTADGNIIHVWASLKYRIANAWDYEFRFAEVTNVVQNVLDNALNYVSSRYTAQDALYRRTDSFREEVVSRVNRAIEDYKLGITVVTVDWRSSPPLAVRRAFEDVQSAEQERNKRVNEARAYARETMNRAQGQAKAIVNEGIVRSNQVVQAVLADERAFLDQMPSYQRNPGLFEQRMLMDVLLNNMPKGQDKFIFAQPSGQGQELRFQLNREPQPLRGTNAP